MQIISVELTGAEGFFAYFGCNWKFKFCIQALDFFIAWSSYFHLKTCTVWV